MIDKIKAEMKTYLDEIGNEDYDLLYLLMEKYLKWAEETELKIRQLTNRHMEKHERDWIFRKELQGILERAFHSKESGE